MTPLLALLRVTPEQPVAVIQVTKYSDKNKNKKTNKKEFDFRSKNKGGILKQNP